MANQDQNDPTQSGNATIQQILKENEELKFKIAKLEQIGTDKMLKEKKLQKSGLSKTMI
jgi:hypothetical protein